MIEDPEKTLAILEYFAQDKIDNPSNLIGDDLVNQFPEWGKNVVFYHIRCAKECGLLDAIIIRQDTIGNGTFFIIANIDGLTAAGGSYVMNSRNPKLWNQAKQMLKKTGQEATTAILVDLLAALALKALGV